MTHPVLVAGFADEARLLARWADSQPEVRASRITAVGLDFESQAVFRKYGYETRNTLPYLNETGHWAIFLNASRYARQWFKNLPPEAIAQLSYDGISYPECLEYDIAQVFTEIFLHIELLRAILRKERPDPLVVMEPYQAPVNTLIMTSKERLLFPLAMQVCAGAGIAMQTVAPHSGFTPHHSKLPGLRPLLHKSWDLLRAVRMSERPLWALLNDGLPVVLSFAFPGRIVYESKIRRYRQASRKVLFWGGVKAKERIREELQRDPTAQVLILDGSPRLRFRHCLLPRVDPRQLCAAGQSERAAVRQQANAAWHLLASDYVFQEQWQYAGVKLWPVLAARMEFYVRTRFPECVDFYEATRTFLRRYGGDVLVSSLDSGGFTPWICRAFSSLGKESVYFWHGLLIPHRGIEEGLRPAFLPLRASRVAAFGTGIADWYRRNGVAAERTRLVGFPDLAPQKALSPGRRQSLCRILGLRADNPIVVYATSVSYYGGRRAYSEETADEILRATQEILEELAGGLDLQVIVKLHPGLPARELAMYTRLARRFANSVVCQKPDLAWLVQLCEILITYQSSAGIEALACDKNVIIYNTTGRRNQYTPQAARLEDGDPNFMVLVDERAQLRSTVEKLLTDGPLRRRLCAKRRQIEPHILFNADGGAVHRAMLLVAEAAAGANSEPRDRICPKLLSIPH